MFEFTIPTGGVPRSRRSIATSVCAHAFAIALLFVIRFSSISNLPVAPEHVTLIAPVEDLAARPKIKPVRPRELPAPRKARVEGPAPPSIPATPVPAPEIEMPKQVALREPVAPAIPQPEPLPETRSSSETKSSIKLSGFSDSKPVPPVSVPKLQVKNAGFETQPVSANASAHSTLGPVGSFDPARGSEAPSARHATSLDPAGFDGASTSAPSAARRTTVTSGMFGDTTVGTNSQASLRETSAPRSTPVEILSKPKPLYTAEARAQRIEGEVLIEVEFSASGEVNVLRLVRGLGHGLDENAAVAARGIRFRPASRASVAVDSTAIVHIIFELAN